MSDEGDWERRYGKAIKTIVKLETERDRLRSAQEKAVEALLWLADASRYDITVTSYARATLALIDRDAALAKEAGQ